MGDGLIIFDYDCKKALPISWVEVAPSFSGLKLALRVGVVPSFLGSGLVLQVGVGPSFLAQPPWGRGWPALCGYNCNKKLQSHDDNFLRVEEKRRQGLALPVSVGPLGWPFLFRFFLGPSTSWGGVGPSGRGWPFLLGVGVGPSGLGWPFCLWLVVGQLSVVTTNNYK